MEGWQLWKLAHAYPRIGSGTTPPSNGDHFYSRGDGSGLPWVTTAELRENHIDATESRVTEEALKTFSALRVYAPGSLMIAMYGATIGRLGITTTEAACNQACCVFEESKQFENRFLFYWLWHRRNDLIALSVGGGQPNLSQQDLKQERALCPPIETQQRIAQFLDEKTARIDALIEKKRVLLDRLAEKRQALITRVVTKGLNPDAPMKPSGVDWLGDIPAHWDVTSLGHRYEVQLGRMLNTERADGENLKPYLRVLDVQWGKISVEDLPMMDFPPSSQARYRLKQGDLLVNEGGSYVGRSAIWQGELPECYYQKALHRIRPLNKELDSPQFLYFIMEMATMGGIFIAGGNQTTIDHLTAEQLRHYKFPFPPFDEQVKTKAFLDKKSLEDDVIREKISRSILQLEEYRVAAVTSAVTGHLHGLS